VEREPVGLDLIPRTVTIHPRHGLPRTSDALAWPASTNFAEEPDHMNTMSNAYLVGGGIGSLAAAAFMIRDGHLPGENIRMDHCVARLARSAA
jgi:myosin-crossreactive antigen